MSSIIKDKLIQGMPFEEYSKIQAINATQLKKIHKSAAHLKAFLEKQDDEDDEDDDEKESLLFGSAFHAALLEPVRFKDFLKVFPKCDRRTIVGKKIASDFAASLAPGDIVVKEKWINQITGMLKSLESHSLVSKLLINGSREVCLFWDDEETGELCKCRFDFITDDGIPLDIKTTRDAHPEKASKTIFSDYLLYWIQAGHYASGAKKTKVCNWEAFNFIFIEKEPPYALSVKVLEGLDLDVAMTHRNKLMRQYSNAKKTNIWESYSPEPTLAVSGDWFLNKYGKENT